VANISGAQLLFPTTYIFGDIFTEEVYGYGASRRAIWLGFFASAILLLMACSSSACRRRRIGRSIGDFGTKSD
jgi:uncharacterized PurR-regulated membrane protein YhhQ (DUF165 family)